MLRYLLLAMCLALGHSQPANPKVKRVHPKLKRVKPAVRKEERKALEAALKDTDRLQTWFDERSISDGDCFVHVPRTGGLSFLRSARKLNISIDSWHTSRKQPRTDCGCMTNIRDPVDRYISEWKFYGLRYFKKKKRLFGWQPAKGFPKSFYDFVQDTSTHNTMTKVLSGCQMYSNCVVDEHSVQSIVQRVKSGCLKVMKTEDMPVHAHKKVFEAGGDNWEKYARKANALDVLLYDELMKL